MDLDIQHVQMKREMQSTQNLKFLLLLDWMLSCAIGREHATNQQRAKIYVLFHLFASFHLWVRFDKNEKCANDETRRNRMRNIEFVFFQFCFFYRSYV